MRMCYTANNFLVGSTMNRDGIGRNCNDIVADIGNSDLAGSCIDFNNQTGPSTCICSFFATFSLSI